MTKLLRARSLGGEISAVPSKSQAHRLLVCSALSGRTTEIACRSSGDDIEATVSCLNALGAKIKYENGIFSVQPIEKAPESATLNCGESGSTLRFLLPVACKLSENVKFIMSGRMSERPLLPLILELERHGATISQSGNILCVSGNLSGDSWAVDANASTQFVSGLLFLLSLTGGSLKMKGRAEGSSYIDMTCHALNKFGAEIVRDNNLFKVKKTTPLISPQKCVVEGDWSNAAFFIVAGVVGKYPVTIKGLEQESAQGDRRIIEIMRSFGAKIEVNESNVTAYPSALTAVEIDASQVPDLVPPLSVAVAAAKGTSRIYGASVLRFKESDRLESTFAMLKSLGGDADKCDDGLIIRGGKALCGGTVSAYGDHRIAMSAAVSAAVCSGDITLEDAQAVNKSYPLFWEDYEKLLMK